MTATAQLADETTSKASAEGLAYVGSLARRRDSDSWFTPAVYIESVKAALGGCIGLDPFSSAPANSLINATSYLTVEDDAFTTAWAPLLRQQPSQTVWMNPPYSGQICRAAVNLFIDTYESAAISAGIILVNNATETSWFQRALGVATAICLPNHRISFWNADGKAQSGNTRGQTFFYFGPAPTQFQAHFHQHGTVIQLDR